MSMTGVPAARQLVASAKPDGDALIVSVQGDVDLNNSPQLRMAMLELMANHRPKRLIVNLSQVPYMDSSAIAVLVELLRKLGKSGKLFLTDLQPRVKGLLEIARLDTIFTIAKSEQDVLRQ